MSDVVLKTIIAEAGGDPAAMAAVAAVIHNRAVAQGKTPEQIVKAKGQFEGYSNPGPASVRAQNDASVRARASQVWSGVKSGTIADPTNGATMYHADYVKPYWAKSANKNGTVNIGGNVFYKGSGTPATALAAIDRAVAPNPQSRPPALAYAQPPTSVRAISVKPNGQPADLMSGLGAKFPGLNFTMSGNTDKGVTGLDRPPQVPRTASLAPVVPQQLVSHPVQTVRIDPMTGNPVGTNSAPTLQEALNTKAAQMAQSRAPAPPPANPMMRSVPPKTDFQLFGTPALNDFEARANASLKAHPAQPPAVPAPPQMYQPPNRPNAVQMAAINAVPQAASFPPFTPNGMKPTQVASAPINGAAPLDNRYLGLTNPPPIPAGVAAMPPANPLPRVGAPTPHPYPTNPTHGQIVTGTDGNQYQYVQMTGGVNGSGNASFGWSRLGSTPRPVPTVPVRSVGPQPLTKFLPAGQKQNDTMTTIGNNVGNALSATPAGHLYSLLTGAPNTGGGILNGLFGYGGLFNGGQTASAPPPVPQRTAVPTLPPDVHAALMAQQSDDQRGQAALRASGMIDSFGMIR